MWGGSMSNLTTPAAVVPTQAAADKVAGTPPHNYPAFWGTVIGIVLSGLALVPDGAWRHLIDYVPPKVAPIALAALMYGVAQLRLWVNTWKSANTSGPPAGATVTVAGGKGP